MSMSNVIPKDQLSAYQRWEMETLDEANAVSAVPLPTAEEVEQIQRQAHQEGFQEGREEGLRQGLEAGREQGYREGREQALEEGRRLHQLLSQTDEAVRRLEDDMAPPLLDLALAIAGQVLRQALVVRPELVLPVVREAINCLPQANQHPRLILHPDDAVLVRDVLETELAQGHWHVVEDERMTPGGCRLETAHSELDASLENRWKRALDALGKNGDWLGEK